MSGFVFNEFGYYDARGQWVPRVPVPVQGHVAPVPFGASQVTDVPAAKPRARLMKHIPLSLAKVNTSGTTRTSASVAARIDNPSARLVHSFSLAFEPKTPQAFTNYQSAVYSATAIRPRLDGRESTLHAIFSNRSLPELWEVSSAVRGIIVEATLKIPLTAAAAEVEGEWVLVAEWEPAMPMCEEEFWDLASGCVARQTLYTDPLAP